MELGLPMTDQELLQKYVDTLHVEQNLKDNIASQNRRAINQDITWEQHNLYKLETETAQQLLKIYLVGLANMAIERGLTLKDYIKEDN